MNITKFLNTPFQLLFFLLPQFSDLKICYPGTYFLQPLYFLIASGTTGSQYLLPIRSQDGSIWEIQLCMPHTGLGFDLAYVHSHNKHKASHLRHNMLQWEHWHFQYSTMVVLPDHNAHNWGPHHNSHSGRIQQIPPPEMLSCCYLIIARHNLM